MMLSKCVETQSIVESIALSGDSMENTDAEQSSTLRWAQQTNRSIVDNNCEVCFFCQLLSTFFSTSHYPHFPGSDRYQSPELICRQQFIAVVRQLPSRYCRQLIRKFPDEPEPESEGRRTARYCSTCRTA
ncbi:hypothetical protein KIN20_013019 [Parelaphostrongylus tenuis]|uniref:Uncharacterized protein n=1 Tax=Parelaphostrongylus tenuis TaxID=148309 RepID=A0AAD5MCX2_PARTN|nr:hypothetical protein KIN20_013019 [Parelaphostrongylus tenuis]